jgi:aminoglycoside N3'-acetyltransferase
VPVTKDNLVTDLRALGVRSGDSVMLHSSFKAIGPVAGGPDTVVDALLEAVGPCGTVMAFVSWDRCPYNEFVLGPGLTDEERAAWPAFDPADAGVDRSISGLLGERLVRHPAAIRSANPDLSMVAIGRNARDLMEDHEISHGFGPGSPLDRLVKRAGKSLLLGAPRDSATIVHHAEYLCAVPGKLTVSYEVPILIDGRKVWQRATQIDSNGFLASIKASGVDHVAEVVEAYLGAGRGKEGTVGKAPSYLFDAADLVAFAVRHFESRYGRNG